MRRVEVARIVRKECAVLLRQGVLDPSTFKNICDLYPAAKWDWHSLGRWFLFFGAISTAAGASILIRDNFGFTLDKLAVLLGAVLIGLIFGGFRLKRKGYDLTGRALELLAAIDIIGLSFTLGAIYSTGSGNWPALLLIDLIIILPLAYLLHNYLILILSAVLFFVWFGGVTGYVSGWGAYYFGMNYPLRFLCASAIIVGGAVLHLRNERGLLANYRGFFKVWLSTGLFFGEMSLWLLSIFGNYETIYGSRYSSSGAELFAYNLMWGAMNGFLIYLGSREAVRMAVGYGATFLIIQAYTIYFTHIAPALSPFIAFGLAGLSALAISFHIEKLRRKLDPEQVEH